MQILELPEFRDLTFRLPDCYRIRQGHGYRLAIGLIGEAEIWPMASILRLMTVTVGLPHLPKVVVIDPDRRSPSAEIWLAISALRSSRDSMDGELGMEVLLSSRNTYARICPTKKGPSFLHFYVAHPPPVGGFPRTLDCDPILTT